MDNQPETNTSNRSVKENRAVEEQQSNTDLLPFQLKIRLQNRRDRGWADRIQVESGWKESVWWIRNRVGKNWGKKLVRSKAILMLSSLLMLSSALVSLKEVRYFPLSFSDSPYIGLSLQISDLTSHDSHFQIQNPRTGIGRI